MSTRDWLWNIALGGIITVPLSLAVIVVVLVNSPEEKPNAPGYQNPCYQADTTEQRDLCQQFRMAESTEDLVGLTQWQIAGTGLEILLIAFAVGIATWAAWEARRAARYGKDSVDVADRAAKAQLRAYVHVSNAWIEWDGDIPIAHVVIKNFGQTPAYDVVGATIAADGEGNDFTDFSVDGPLSKDNWGPQLEITKNVRLSDFDQFLAMKARGGLHDIFVWGRIDYRDAFKNPCWTEFRFQMGGPVPGKPDIYVLNSCPEGNRCDNNDY